MKLGEHANLGQQNIALFDSPLDNPPKSLIIRISGY